MKTLKARFLGLCSLMVLLAATLAPSVAEAVCPKLIIACGSDSHTCAGVQSNGKCIYNESCLNC